MPNICFSIKQEYEALKTINAEFVLACEKAGDPRFFSPEQLREFQVKKQHLEHARDALKDELFMLRWQRFDPQYVRTVEKKVRYTERTIFNMHTRPALRIGIATLQMLPDGRIVSGSHDGSIRIQEKNKFGHYEIVDEIQQSEGIAVLQYLPDGKIVSGGFDNVITISERDARGEYRTIAQLSGHTGAVRALRVLPDGRIVSAGEDKTVRVWGKNKDVWEHVVLEGHTRPVKTLQVFPDGRIVSAGEDYITRIWEFKDGGWKSEELTDRDRERFTTTHTLQALPDGTIVIASGRSIGVWRREKDGAYVKKEEMRTSGGEILTLQVLPDGRIVTGGSEPGIRIWTKEAGGWKSEEHWTHNSVFTLRVLSDGRIVTGDADGVIRIWDGEKEKS